MYFLVEVSHDPERRREAIGLCRTYNLCKLDTGRVFRNAAKAVVGLSMPVYSTMQRSKVAPFRDCPSCIKSLQGLPAYR